MKNNYLKTLAILLLVGAPAIYAQQDAQFTVVITNNLPYTIAIEDRELEEPLKALATLQPGQTQSLSGLRLYTQETDSRSILEIGKGGKSIAELILIKQFGSVHNKPAVLLNLVPFPHWIGGSKFVHEELDHDANVFNVTLTLQEDEEGTLEPSELSLSKESQ